MKHPEFDARYAQLLAELQELLDLLTKYGEHHWAAIAAKEKAALEEHDPRSIERLVAAFGIMGNFNELYLSPQNGHTIAEADVAQVEEHLADLASRIWLSAKFLKKSLERRK